MNQPPAFQFYAGDFLSNENVMCMTNQEVGCYIKLLCINWKQGSIPNDIGKIARLCGEDDSAMAQLWDGIKPCFKENGDNRLYNPRLERERKKQEEFRQERSESGKRGAAKRWEKHTKDSSATKQPLANDGSSSSPSKDITTLVPHQKIVELYHTILPELRRVKIWSDTRKAFLKSRWREDESRQNLEWWDTYFKKVKASDWLMGRKKDSTWQADLEWLVRPKNFVKVVEGNYDGTDKYL